MGQDRVSQDRLILRVAELYAGNELDHDLLDYGKLIEAYDAASGKVVANLGVYEKREWSSYGCGFASFVESWYYRKNRQFEDSFEGQYESSFRGVSIIFSLLEPMFAAGESRQGWGSNGDSNLLPSIDMVDNYETDAVHSLSRDVCRVLRDVGIPQVSRRTLDAEIDNTIRIESNMSDGPLRIFDAFYHWED